MSVLIKMEMPKSCLECPLLYVTSLCDGFKPCPLVPVPPHGDLIDRDALIKDGWLCLYKEVGRMGGYAIHELPLKNLSIPVIIEAEEGE